MLPWYRVWVWNSKTAKWAFSSWVQGIDMAEYVGTALHDRYGVQVYVEWTGG